MIPLTSIASPRTRTVEVCAVNATMYGTAIDGEHPVQGHFCASANMYVFVIYDGNHYKMAAVPLEQAKVSRAPASSDKFITIPRDSINLEAIGTACNMWEGYGYETKTYNGYDLKDVQVTGCGWYIVSTPTDSYVNVPS